jgi:hypothetical protein
MTGPKDIFNDLPDLVSTNTHDKLNRYLMADVEKVKDGLMWWNESAQPSCIYPAWPVITFQFLVSCFSFYLCQY